MKGDIGNYAQHAQYWGWGGHDNTPEYEYWRRYAAKYGNTVLIPMCATGEAGAYMAERGMCVTAFDITPEMIAEGKKRFGGVQGLTLAHGDVRDFRFGIAPADFCFCTDFGHLHTIDDVRKALACINAHLRDGGCLVIKTGLRSPDDISSLTPAQTYYPIKQVYPGKRVWKTGETRNDAETGRFYISQVFYAEHENGHMESFSHAFYLQSYYHREWLSALRECGFDIISEQYDGGYHIFESVKRARIPQERICFAETLVSRIDSGEGGIFRDSAEARTYVDCQIYERGMFHSCEIFGGLRVHVALSEDTDEYNEDIALRIKESLNKTERDSCHIWLRNENKRAIEFLVSEFAAKPDGKRFYASIEFIMRREVFDRAKDQSILEVRPYEEERVDDYLTLLDGSMTFSDPPADFVGRKEHFLKHFRELRQQDSIEAFWKDDTLIGLYWRKNAEIMYFAVAADHQRKGYGTIMLTRALSMVFEKTDADFAYLYAVDWNIKGQSFYRKYGMVENGHSFGIKIRNYKGE